MQEDFRGEKFLNILESFFLKFCDFFIFIENEMEFIHISGALGQTRTGTPKRARILSPLCLPISPRGPYSYFINVITIKLS